MDEMKPLYDSRAVPESDFQRAEWIGWDRLPARHGMVYLRNHLSGPIAPTGEWCVVSA